VRLGFQSRIANLARILQGIGGGALQPIAQAVLLESFPVETFSVATVSRENMGAATGLTNLLRNLGGSVGISAITAILSRGEQTHQALMVDQTSQFNPVFNEQLAKMRTALTPQVSSTAAHDQAYGLIYQTLQRKRCA
jgi:MFS transporter, DHA2 family, multidrug resistance protein